MRFVNRDVKAIFTLINSGVLDQTNCTLEQFNCQIRDVILQFNNVHEFVVDECTESSMLQPTTSISESESTTEVADVNEPNSVERFRTSIVQDDVSYVVRKVDEDSEAVPVRQTHACIYNISSIENHRNSNTAYHQKSRWKQQPHY